MMKDRDIGSSGNRGIGKTLPLITRITLIYADQEKFDSCDFKGREIGESVPSVFICGELFNFGIGGDSWRIGVSS